MFKDLVDTEFDEFVAVIFHHLCSPIVIHLSSIFQWTENGSIFLSHIPLEATKPSWRNAASKSSVGNAMLDSQIPQAVLGHGLSQPWKTDSFCKDEILEVLEEPAQLHFYIWYDLIWFYIWQHCNMHATWQNNSSDRAFFMPLLPWCWWFRARRHRGTGGKNTPLQFL